jgi:predicted XRE-type DNA-binding protein
VHFELPDEVREAVDHARATTAEAQCLASVAAEEYRQAVRDLVIDRGMSKADVAALLQVSQQRVSHLVP